MNHRGTATAGEAELLHEYPELSKRLELVVVLPGPNRTLAALIAPRSVLGLLAEHPPDFRQLPESADRINAGAEQVSPGEKRNGRVAQRRHPGSRINPQGTGSTRRTVVDHPRSI